MSRKCVLITGAGGFLGSACVEEFLGRSWDVIAMYHRTRPDLDSGVMCVQADIADKSRINEIFAEFGPFDAVVHCAAKVSDCGRDDVFRKTILDGTVNIARCLARQKKGRLVYISTTDVYGLQDFFDADEGNPVRNWPGNSYQKYKILTEQAIKEILPGWQYVILRPGVIWGAGDRAILPRMAKFLKKSGRIVHFGRWRGRNRWPVANVRNTARAAFLSAVMDQAVGQIFNVVDPGGMTLDEYWRRIVTVVAGGSFPAKPLFMPFIGAWIYAQAWNLLGKLTGIESIQADPSIYALAMLASNLDFSGRKLQALFKSAGEKFITIEEGLTEFTGQLNLRPAEFSVVDKVCV